MTSIRMGLFSFVVLLALALVGPAGASATAVWELSGAPLEEHAEIGLEGSQSFVTEAGAMICEHSRTRQQWCGDQCHHHKMHGLEREIGRLHRGQH